MEKVRKVIKCEKTLELINKSLKAGYIDPETLALHREDKGTAQGSVLSPLLSNIVLHELDQFMYDLKKKFHKGAKRRRNPAYVNIISKRRSIRDLKARKQMLREARKLYSLDQMDPNFKRLKYVRYADDFVVLVIGSYKEAEKIRVQISNLLASKCGLKLNMEKSVITHIQKKGFQFLGASCAKADRTKNHVIKHARMESTRANVRLRVNVDMNKIFKKLTILGFAK